MKELIENLRGFGSTENDWKAADAIESLVRERDGLVRKMNARKPAAVGYAKRLEKKLSAIRAAVEQVIDAWIAAGSPVEMGHALNSLENTINDEAQIKETPFPLISEEFKEKDSREAFEARYEAHALPLESDWFRRNKDFPDMYALDFVEHAWDGWKAALAWRDSQPQNPFTDGRAELCMKVCEGITDDGLRAWLNPPAAGYGAPNGTWASQLWKLWDEKELYRQMFHDAIRSLALINEHLELDPDEGGHEPIIQAIDELKSSQPQAEPVAFHHRWKHNGLFAGVTFPGESYPAVGLDTTPVFDNPPRAEVPEGFTDKLWKDVCTLQRYSFFLVDGLVRRVPDKTGNWLELNDVQKIVDHDRIAAMLQSAPKRWKNPEPKTYSAPNKG